MILSSVLIEANIFLQGSATVNQDNPTIAGTTQGEPPVAIISFPVNNSKFDPVQAFRFDGSQSYDPDGGVVTYLWVPDPIPVRWGNPSGSPENRPFFNTRLDAGNYTITLTVTDEEGLTDILIWHVIIKMTTGSTTTVEPTITTGPSQTTSKDILTVRPNFLPGYSVLLAIFALFIPVVLKRKKKS